MFLAKISIFKNMIPHSIGINGKNDFHQSFALLEAFSRYFLSASMPFFDTFRFLPEYDGFLPDRNGYKQHSTLGHSLTMSDEKPIHSIQCLRIAEVAVSLTSIVSPLPFLSILCSTAIS